MLKNETYPLVSVIIPTFNRVNYIGRAIESVIGQTFPNFEIIIIDDGSTDDTCKYINSLNNNKIKYYYQSNKGVAAARNKGLEVANGDFIAFLDSDDEWLPQKIEKQLNLFKSNPLLGMAYCGSEILNEENKVLTRRYCQINCRGKIFKHLILNNFIPTPTVIIKKNIIKKAGRMVEDLKFGEDWHYWLKVSLLTEVDFINEIQVRFRRLEDGLTNKDFKYNINYSKKVIELIFDKEASSKKYMKYKMKAFANQEIAEAKHLLWKFNNGSAAMPLLFSAIKKDSFNWIAYYFLLKSFVYNQLIKLK